MRTVDYIELRAKALVSELAQTWNDEKRRELREVLNDLEDAEETPTAPVAPVQLELIETQPDLKRTRRSFPRKPHGFREWYIKNVLDAIEQREKEGYLEGNLYAEHFSLDFSYFSSKLFPYLNMEAHRRNRLMRYRISYKNCEDHIHYVLMRSGEADHVNA